MSYQLIIGSEHLRTIYLMESYSSLKIDSTKPIEATEIEKIKEIIKAVETLKKARDFEAEKKPKFNVTTRLKEDTSTEGDQYKRARLFLENSEKELKNVKERYGVVKICVTYKNTVN